MKTERIMDIGFEKAGEWGLSNENLKLVLGEKGEEKNALYAFVVEGTVKYIGKTAQQLKKRMYGYQKPGRTQSTNIKNNKNIKEQLLRKKKVEIFCYIDSEERTIGEFHLNTAAGLEDDLIKKLKKAEKDCWNN